MRFLVLQFAQIGLIIGQLETLCEFLLSFRRRYWLFSVKFIPITPFVTVRAFRFLAAQQILACLAELRAAAL
jgi:hypothetical protein